MKRAGKTVPVTWSAFDLAAAAAWAECHHLVTVKEVRGH